jgi:hypothetical protein
VSSISSVGFAQATIDSTVQTNRIRDDAEPGRTRAFIRPLFKPAGREKERALFVTDQLAEFVATQAARQQCAQALEPLIIRGFLYGRWS